MTFMKEALIELNLIQSATWTMPHYVWNCVVQCASTVLYCNRHLMSRSQNVICFGRVQLILHSACVV